MVKDQELVVKVKFIYKEVGILNMKVTIKRDHVVPIGLASLLALMFLASGIYAATYEVGTTTLNASVNVFVEIVPSTQLDEGIFFGSVDKDTIGNPAQNNSNCDSGTCYNVTVDSASNVNIDFYNDVTATLAATMYINETSSTTDSQTGFSTNTTVDTSYSIMGNTSVNCTDVVANGNCWSKYYLDVASGTSGGIKSTTYQYCGVETGTSDTQCV